MIRLYYITSVCDHTDTSYISAPNLWAPTWVKSFWHNEEQNTNELPLKRSLQMGNSAHLSTIRGDHKNRGVNRRKNEIDRKIEE